MGYPLKNIVGNTPRLQIWESPDTEVKYEFLMLKLVKAEVNT